MLSSSGLLQLDSAGSGCSFLDRLWSGAGILTMLLIYPTMRHKMSIKVTVLLCMVLVFSLGAACPPDADPRITVTEDSLAIRVTEVEGGITIENLSGIDCIVYVRSPEGEKTFELGAGESITVTGITAPIEVGAVAG